MWYSTAYSIYYEVYSIQYTVYRRFINEIRKVCLFFFYFIFIFYCISYFYLLFFHVLYCNWCALVSKLDLVFLIYHVFSFTCETLCIACDLFERCYRNKVFFLFFSFLFSFLLKFMDKNIIMEKIQSVWSYSSFFLYHFMWRACLAHMKCTVTCRHKHRWVIMIALHVDEGCQSSRS